MRVVLVLLLAVLLAGCNPYMAAVSAVSATYGAATDVRSVSTQASDAEIEARIKAALVASPVSGTSSISAYCRQGVVVLTGVVPPGSSAGAAAVSLARETQGVSRVETFFVRAQPSLMNDLEIKGKVQAALIADPNIVSGRVDVAVYAGHVVLIGVVDSYQKADEFIQDAQSVDGVVSVRSYIQVAA
jgi:osmotically-inducible protein OsmY